MFVLGVDPGLTRCGYGAVERTRSGLRAVAAGVIRTPTDADLADRLAELLAGVQGLLTELRPDAVAVERVFFQANARTAMSVGQASGVVLAAASAAGCEVAQYTPNEVKVSVTGSGSAAKEQVQRMVQAVLGLQVRPDPPDAADALALAVCHHAVAPLRRRIDDAERSRSRGAHPSVGGRPGGSDPPAVRRPGSTEPGPPAVSATGAVGTGAATVAKRGGREGARR